MSAKIITTEYEFDLLEFLNTKNIDFKISGRNIMMCCPFHEEKNPSFGINIQTGKYNCLSGSCKAHGHLEGFVQKIEGLSSLEAAESWLRGIYGTKPDDVNKPFDLVFGDASSDVEIDYIPEEELKEFDFRHPYLEGRGIPDVWQRRFRIGYDKEAGAITLPWFDRHNRCVGIKRRSVFSKHFWVYHISDVGPNKITLFGVNHVFRRREPSIAIVESEIDALYLWSQGFPAVALGTAHITDKQLNELKNCPIERVTIATDNDEAGRKIAGSLIWKLDWVSDIRVVDWNGLNVKDVNELDAEGLQDLFQKTKNPITNLLKNQNYQ